MTTRRWEPPEPRNKLTRKQYAELYLRQDGRCPECLQKLEVKGGEDVTIRDEHVLPLWAGGKNELSNRELWCLPCTKVKDAAESTQRAKGKRVRDKHIGAPIKKRSSFNTNKDGPYKVALTANGPRLVHRKTGKPVQ